MTHTIRATIGILLVLAFAPAVAWADGYGIYPAYTGTRLPAGAAVFSAYAGSNLLDGTPGDAGYFLDTDGDGAADVADFAQLVPAAHGFHDIRSLYVSPSNPDVAYVLCARRDPSQQPWGFRFGIATLERVNGQWRTLRGFAPVWLEMNDQMGSVNLVHWRHFAGDWGGIVGVQRVEGRDRVLVVSRYADGVRRYNSRYALYVDGDDADPYADTWLESREIPMVEAMTLDDRGQIIARRVLSAAEANGNSEIMTIRDENGDGIPEAIVPGSVFTTAPYQDSNLMAGAFGPATVDLGADRLDVLVPYRANLDSRRRIIPESVHRSTSFRFPPGGGPVSLILLEYEFHTMSDGSLLNFSNDQRENELGSLLIRDVDFDEKWNDLVRAEPLEVLLVARVDSLPRPWMTNVSPGYLEEIPVTNGQARAAFASFGEFPGGETFRFRFGSVDHPAVTVNTNGTVSFGSPVTGTPSVDALSRLQGVIAPAWGQWDTSRVRIFAGYAPVQKSFVTGERVLAFSIEWRGLRQQGWEEDRAFSMRLLLFSDGTWRTDYGAIGEVETPFVVGYAGPGAATTSASLDASAHSWNATWVGAGTERVMAEAFTSTNDVGHKWIRYRGYPERQDTAGPAPEVVNAKAKKGKLSMTARGSEIVEGAVVEVDGVEVFTLTKSAAGAKWLVKASARSTPSDLSIAQLFPRGTSRTIVVVNPDGQRSHWVTLVGA